MKKHTLAIISLVVVILIASIVVLKNNQTIPEITDFESCIAAGNPAMESHPRQCRDPISDKTFTEVLIGGDRDEHGCLGPAGYFWNETLQVCLRDWEITGQDRQVLEYALNYTTKEKGLTVIDIVEGECEGCFIVEFDILGRTKTVDVFGEIKYFCSPESRGPNLYCIQVYEPVCGSDNKTHSNSCTACLNSSVEYYITGECP